MKHPRKNTPVIPPPFLYATAALSGACIMVVEILGAKMLAPYVGTSHFVWLAQITVTLLALAIGYFLGGRLADHKAAPRPLFMCLIAAALYLAASVPLVRPVAMACLNLELALGSLLASAFLFFVPLCLMAATAPFYVRLLTLEVAHVGNKSGRLSAASTLGSVAGTVIVGYFVIPQLPNSATMYIACAALLAWSALYFIKYDAKARVAALLVAACGLAGAGWGMKTQIADNPFHGYERLYRAQSPFGELQVVQAPDVPARILLDDLLFQNVYDFNRKQSLADFTYMLEILSESYTPAPKRALCLGMGMGIVPMALAKKGIDVDVVEINPAMVEPAERFFDCDTKKFHLTIGDARTFLNDAKPESYDTVIMDVFAGDASPSHLFSKEAFALVKRALKPGGTLVINTFGQFAPGRNFSVASLCRTLREGAGFPTVRLHAEEQGGNVYVLAGNGPLTLQRFPDFARVHPHNRDTVTAMFNRTVEEPAGGMVLSDDFNPLEFHDAANREEIRRNYARVVSTF